MERAKIYSKEGEKIYDYLDAFVLAQQLSDNDIRLMSENIGLNCTPSLSSFNIRVRCTSDHYFKNMDKSFSIDVLENNREVLKATIIINLKQNEQQGLQRSLIKIGIATYSLHGERCHIEFTTAEQLQSILLKYIEKRYK